MKERRKVKKIRVTILIILLIVSEILVKNALKQQALREKIVTDWTVNYNSASYTTNDLEKDKFPNIRKGDCIEISGILPKLEWSQATLEFITHCSVIEVYVGDELLADYGENLARENKLLGSGLFRVALPEDCAGQRLRIVLRVQENQVFSKLPEIYVSETLYAARNLLVLNFQSAIMITLLLFVTMAEIGALIGFGKQKKYIGRLLMNIGFTLSMAIWLLTYSGLIHIFTDDYGFVSCMGYVSLYLIPVYVLAFLYMSLKGKKYAAVTKGITIVYLLFDVCAIVMNYLNIMHFPESLSIYHGLLLFSCVFVGFLIYKFRREMQIYYGGMFFWGSYLLVLTVLLEVLRYMIHKYFYIGIDLSESFLAFGGFIIAIIAFMGLLQSLKRVVLNQRENEMLKYAAYTDALTKLKNRTYCEEQFQYYRESKKPVTIINMDLNRFKEVNDTYGHSVGDELLIRFAEILKSVFGENNTVGRMGGDEFIVIMDSVPDEKINYYTNILMKCIESNNRVSNKAYRISVSYGYASNLGNLNMDVLDVYKAADWNMYNYKQKKRTNG